MGNTSIEILLALLVAIFFLGDFIWKRINDSKVNQESSPKVGKDAESQVKDVTKKLTFIRSIYVIISVFCALLLKLVLYIFDPGTKGPVSWFDWGFYGKGANGGADWSNLIPFIFENNVIKKALFDEGLLQYFPLALISIIIYFVIDLLIYNRSRRLDLISRLKGFIISRKRNVTMFLLSIPITKLLLHFTVFPYINPGMAISGQHESWFAGNRTFGWYIDNFFSEEIVLFIPAIILPLLFVFLINDKIKAR